MRSVGYFMYWMPGMLLIITLAPGFSKSSELETSTSHNSSGYNDTAKERYSNQPIQQRYGGRPGPGPGVGAVAVGSVLFILLVVLSNVCCCCGIPLCIWGCIVCAQRNRAMDGPGYPGRVMGPNPQMVPRPYYSNTGMQQQYSQQYPPLQTV